MKHSRGERRRSRKFDLNESIRYLEDEEFNAKFSPEAIRILSLGKDDPAFRLKRKRRKPSIKHKRRKLMPHDWAFILRERGLPYEKSDIQPLNRRMAQPGSKSSARIALSDKTGQDSKLPIAVLRRYTDLMRHAVLSNENAKRMKANRNIAKAEKIIARIHDRGKETKTEIQRRIDEQTIVISVEESIYELLDSQEAFGFPVQENSDTIEKFKPYFEGTVNRLKVVPKHDQYSPYLIYRLDGIERRFMQTNSASEWVFDVFVGEYLGSEERFEA